MRSVGPRLSGVQRTGTQPRAQSNEVCFSWILLNAKSATIFPRGPAGLPLTNGVWKRKNVSDLANAESFVHAGFGRATTNKPFNHKPRLTFRRWRKILGYYRRSRYHPLAKGQGADQCGSATG